MKLIYINNIRLPSEKANSYQSMQMCSSFSKLFDEVELWTGKARNTRELSEIKDVFEYYNIEKSFLIRKFFQFDSIVLGYLNEFVWANLRDFVFSLNACLHLIRYRKSQEVLIYTRVWYLLYTFLLFKKIGLVDEIIKEPLGGAHTFPDETFKIVKKSISKAIKEFIDTDKDTLVHNRMEKFSNMGVVNE